MNFAIAWAAVSLTAGIGAQRPEQIILPNYPGSEIGGASYPRLATKADSIHAVCRASGPYGAGLYSLRSTDRGATWSLPVRFTDPAAVPWTDKPELDVEGQRISVIWRDLREGTGDVYFNQSRDGGVTWLPQDRRISSGAFGIEPRLHVRGTKLFVIWRNGSTLLFNRSLDGGTLGIAVPDDTSLVGAGLVFQAIVVDAGGTAANGLAMSNALEIWIG